MTSVDPSGSARPGRVAGLALLGVAAVALVIGLVTVFGGNGEADGRGSDQADDQQTTSPRPPTTTTSKPPTTTTTPPATTTRPTTTRPPSSAPPTTPPGGDNNGEPQKATPVRVLNNSNIKGLAAQAADDLRASGWDVVEVGNFPGLIPTTTVYFRPGTGEEVPARALGAEFGMRVEPRFESIAKAQPGLIVIVTRDYLDGGGKDSGGGK